MDLYNNIPLKLINRIFMSVIYGDLLMRVLYRVRPYEKRKRMYDLDEKWVLRCKDSLVKASNIQF